MDITTPLVLIVLDGFGYSTDTQYNAIAQANAPVWQDLWCNCPHLLLDASGLAVGLPDGQMGNSEVGHMTIGAGRVIYQDLTRINLAIEQKSFFSNAVLSNQLNEVATADKALHILGLLSPGGIHSHEEHINALIKMAQDKGVQKIYLHAFLDGRDTPPKSATASLTKFAPFITSIMGRFYAMDRDKRFERTALATKLLLDGVAEFHATTPEIALQNAYARGETDEFVKPTIIKPVKIDSDDTVICMNFRTDRARQICHALLDKQPALANNFITLTEYDSELPVQVAFKAKPVHDTLTEIISAHHLRQLHIAETEKYAHVTFFFNAGKEQSVPGEERILIPSPKVTTYDLAPQMSAQLITTTLLDDIKNKKHDVIICNYANPDMLGHTGKLHPTINAIETIDKCLGQLVTAIKEYGGSLLITSDHGNAENMWDTDAQQEHTAHTTNLVPLVYVGPKDISFKQDKTYGLQDIAPTMLDLLNISKPKAMTGVSLISKD